MFKSRRLALFVVILVVGLAACAKPTPIPVFVTPTSSQPTATITPAPTVSLPTPTGTLPEVTPSTTPVPAGTFGPVVPPGYVPPPTQTPRATQTGIPAPTTEVIAPTPPPPLDGSRVGVQIHPRIEQAMWREMLGRANDIGFGWVKIQFSWDEMEPDGSGSQSDYWRQLELYTQDAYLHQLQVMISITKAPDWARSTTEGDGPPNDPQTLVSFIDHVLSRFGPAISAIEIWNEPNLIREWTGATMNGAQYMRYFDPAYQAITAWSQANNHPIQVVTAGLAPTGTSDYSVDDRTFLQQMYQAGLGNYTDVAIGIHPYGWGNAPQDRCCNPVPDRSWDDDPHFFFQDNIEAYHQILTSYGDDAQLWITEFGWATYDGFGVEAPQEFFNYLDETLQAQYTVDAIEILEKSGNYPYVGPMMLWNLNFAMLPDAVAVGREEQAGYSLLRPDFTLRPVYTILQRAFKGG